MAIPRPCPLGQKPQPGGNEESRGRVSRSSQPPPERGSAGPGDASGGGAGAAGAPGAGGAGPGPGPGPPPSAAPWDGADVRRRRGNLPRKRWSGGRGAHSARRARHPLPPPLPCAPPGEFPTRVPARPRGRPVFPARPPRVSPPCPSRGAAPAPSPARCSGPSAGAERSETKPGRAGPCWERP